MTLWGLRAAADPARKAVLEWQGCRQSRLSKKKRDEIMGKGGVFRLGGEDQRAFAFV
jgi:hypothetical protein